MQRISLIKTKRSIVSLFQAVSLPGGYTINGTGSNITDVSTIVSRLYTIAIFIGGFLLLYWMTWGVFEYIFAGGDKEKLGKARKRITWAVVGFIIILLAYTIQNYAKDIMRPLSTSPAATSL